MIQKGGIRFSKAWLKQNPELNVKTSRGKKELLKWFLRNSTLSLLTNDSISCVTLKAELNDDISPSPFTSITRQNFQKSVRSILVKIFVTSENIYQENTGWFKIFGRTINNGIEITSFKNFNKEALIQKDIYQKSFQNELTAFEPICPAIIEGLYSTKSLIPVIEEGLENRYKTLRSFANEYDEKRQIRQVLTAGKYSFEGLKLSTSIIFMEFLDGFDTLANTLVKMEPEKRENSIMLAEYTLLQMHKLGYIHGDAHYGNFMINPNYKLYTSSENSPVIGKVLIIDFGRSGKKKSFGGPIEDVNKVQPLRNAKDIEELDRRITYHGNEFKKGLILSYKRWFERENLKNEKNIELLEEVIKENSSIASLYSWYISYIGVENFLNFNGGYKKNLKGGLVALNKKKNYDNLFPNIKNQKSLTGMDNLKINIKPEKETTRESKKDIVVKKVSDDKINFNKFYKQMTNLTMLDFLKNIEEQLTFFMINDKVEKENPDSLISNKKTLKGGKKNKRTRKGGKKNKKTRKGGKKNKRTRKMKR